MTYLQAHLLLASPRLSDGNFYRSVVFLIHHDDEGAFGVVLNRPTPVVVSDIWSQVADEACDNQSPIYLGGPVQGPILALHTAEELSESEVLPGVYLATQKDNLDGLVRQDEHEFRVFTGYSGWGAQQLESELDDGGWLTTAAQPDHIFSDAETIWKQVADAIGNSILFPKDAAKPAPDDPMSN